MSVSLDGFVAGPDGDFEWAAPDEELHRFHNARVGRLSAHLLGRKLYETMVYWETARGGSGDLRLCSGVRPHLEAAAEGRLLEHADRGRGQHQARDWQRRGGGRAPQVRARRRHRRRRARARRGLRRARPDRRVRAVHLAHCRRRRAALLPGTCCAARARARRDPDFRKPGGLHALRETPPARLSRLEQRSVASHAKRGDAASRPRGYFGGDNSALLAARASVATAARGDQCRARLRATCSRPRRGTRAPGR